MKYREYQSLKPKAQPCLLLLRGKRHQVQCPLLPGNCLVALFAQILFDLQQFYEGVNSGQFCHWKPYSIFVNSKLKLPLLSQSIYLVFLSSYCL